MDVLTLLSFTSIWFCAFVKRISTLHVLLTSAISFLTASALVQMLYVLHLEITGTTVQVVVIGANFLGATTIVFLISSKTRAEPNPVALLFPMIFSIVGIAIGRLLAPHQPSASITSLRFLIDAEDNAKWLNISTEIVTNAHIAVGNVGGVLTCFLVVAASIVKLLHKIFSYTSSDIQNSVDSVSIAELLVIPVSTFALASIWAQINSFRRTFVMQALQFAPVAFLFQVFVGNTKGIGHLSLALVIIFMTFGIAGAIRAQNSFVETMAYFFVIELALSIWLPTQIALPAFAVCAILDCNTTWRQSASPHLRLLATLVLLVPTILSIDTFRYVSHTPGYLSSLFSATGGTLQASTTLQYVAILSLAVCLVTSSKSHKQLLKLWPLGFLMVFFAAVQTNDIFRTGQLNYGSLKFGYLFFVVLLFTTLSFTFEKCKPTTSNAQDSNQLIALVVAILLCLPFNTDGVILSFLNPYEARQWPTHFEKSDTSWHPFGSGYSPLASEVKTMPIACVLISPSTSPEVDANTYRCTRFLVAIAGLETSGGRLVEWQLGQDWATAKSRLAGMSPRILDRNILRIDKQSSRFSVVSIRDLLNSF